METETQKQANLEFLLPLAWTSLTQYKAHTCWVPYSPLAQLLFTSAENAANHFKENNTQVSNLQDLFQRAPREQFCHS